ncbi:sugar transferase [Corynebacterium phoceense]|nr:sugar transferase [Corynebacterium phoceense]MCQ9331198.1 sugar transferase [Corynebacterium phoceense]
MLLAPHKPRRTAAALQRAHRPHVAYRTAPAATARGRQVHPARAGQVQRKPGLTGLWQVMGRSTLSWEESINLDLRYCAERSFGMDTMIFFRTFKVLATQEGAY